jgi:hypothetical protein
MIGRPSKRKSACFNVGHGDMQLRHEIHTTQSIELKESFQAFELSLGEGDKRFFRLFRLFEESAEDGRRKTGRGAKDEEICQKSDQARQEGSDITVCTFVRSSNSEMLSWPNSPLFAMLYFVDPNGLFGSSVTLLHSLVDMADPIEYSTHLNQLILAIQLVEHGANVNAVSSTLGEKPLHKAYFAGNVTNLDC